MPILNIVTDQPTGLQGVTPQFIYIDTTDTTAQVTTAGYLDHTKHEGFNYSNNQIAIVSTGTKPNQDVDIYNVSVSAAGVVTLVANINPGAVLLPVVVGNIAVFTNVAGQIGDPAGVAIHGGGIQAGLSGTAGTLTSFPATPNTGFFRITAVANGGAFNTVVTNAALGQTTTFTLPDPGIAATNFLLTNSAGTQTIATGNLTLTLGSLQVTAGVIVAGSTITSGINNASAGSFVAIPAGNNQGSFRFVPVANAGNFASTISNTAIGQASVYSLPDPVNAVARVLVAATATPFTAGHVAIASGTGGLMVDAGYQIKTVAAAVVAGGAAAQVVVDAFVTAASNIVASWNTQTNAASILTVTPGVGSFTVTSSADPGASTLNYIVTKV
jgi:hypothetical protein